LANSHEQSLIHSTPKYFQSASVTPKQATS